MLLPVSSFFLPHSCLHLGVLLLASFSAVLPSFLRKGAERPGRFGRAKPMPLYSGPFNTIQQSKVLSASSLVTCVVSSQERGTGHVRAAPSDGTATWPDAWGFIRDLPVVGGTAHGGSILPVRMSWKGDAVSCSTSLSSMTFSEVGGGTTPVGGFTWQCSRSPR